MDPCIPLAREPPDRRSRRTGPVTVPNNESAAGEFIVRGTLPHCKVANLAMRYSGPREFGDTIAVAPAGTNRLRSNHPSFRSISFPSSSTPSNSASRPRTLECNDS